MNRFEWCDGCLAEDEVFVLGQDGVGLYDGDDKSAFDNGTLQLTTHRLIWRDIRDPACRLGLALGLVQSVRPERGGISKSDKLNLQLSAPTNGTPSGPVTNSRYNHIRLAFRRAGHIEFHSSLMETLKAQCWKTSQAGGDPRNTRPVRQGPRAVGILGIERSIAQKQRSTDKTINEAFEDLSQLMSKAKEMVGISQEITKKLREKKGELTDDETAKFKAYLLSMGISDPVTRSSHGNRYSEELARQLASFLVAPLKEHGGMMSLADAYCRINRARGMELLSPDDLVEAARLMQPLGLQVHLKTFDSGVMVLQLASLNEESTLKSTVDVVESRGSLSSEELARAAGISTILAKERLLLSEGRGLTCRDDSVEGLRFYPNLFMTRVD